MEIVEIAAGDFAKRRVGVRDMRSGKAAEYIGGLMTTSQSAMTA